MIDGVPTMVFDGTPVWYRIFWSCTDKIIPPVKARFGIAGSGGWMDLGGTGWFNDARLWQVMR